MKLSKSELRGTKGVFIFTLQQYAKSKANRITLAIVVILALISTPIMSLIMGDKTGEETSSPITKVYVYNATDYKLQYDSLCLQEGWKHTRFVDGSYEKDNLGENDVYVSLEYDEKESSYVIKADTADNTKLSKDALSDLTGFISERFTESRYKADGVSDKQLSVVMSDFNVDTMSLEKYNSKDEGPGMEALFTVQYAYAIIVLLLCLFSTIYIIRAIIEEKESKLVELLMVSVKPLALILGKILAVMAYIFSTTIITAVAFAVSYFVGGRLTGTSQIKMLLENIGITSSVLNISPATIIIALISLALGYLTMSIIGGISGTCCSSMDDMESANMTVVFIAMFGYFASAIATPFTSEPGSGALAVAITLLPVVSIFCAPVQYVCGNVSIYMLILSWLIQAGFIAALSIFCSRVYEGLIIHKGSRVKLKQLLSMAGIKKQGEVQ